MTIRQLSPDLLNFKKGWMSRLGEDGKWRKHWFVLTDQTLRFYRDSAAEEAADVDGEINLSTCYDVTDFPVQRNYGFQIHTKNGVFTLCAMTYGIRRNWVQAVMKNIHPTIAPDVTWYNIKTSCHSQKYIYPLCLFHTLVLKPNTFIAEQRSRIRERRREGRYKTFDWAELSCKQHKEELSNDPSGRQWNHNSEHSVPPAPASTPEDQIIRSASEASDNEYLKKKRISQRQSLNIMSADIPSNLSLMAVSNEGTPCLYVIMEDSHQRVIEEMQRQHQKEVERLTEERERVLKEETNATIAAIEAMRKAHKEEMDKTQKALEELETLHRELEVLSEQYSQKCLENNNLNRTVETEREALSTTQRENQELRFHNQVRARAHKNVHIHTAIALLNRCALVKESEIKCLKQEINSLKLELQAGNTVTPFFKLKHINS
uniref:Si:ch211-23l10.3 n=1 Tax=Cyprinus carpio TaxID=7962 RepID=A0A8C2DL14_CYPCA